MDELVLERLGQDSRGVDQLEKCSLTISGGFGPPQFDVMFFEHERIGPWVGFAPLPALGLRLLESFPDFIDGDHGLDDGWDGSDRLEGDFQCIQHFGVDLLGGSSGSVQTSESGIGAGRTEDWICGLGGEPAVGDAAGGSGGGPSMLAVVAMQVDRFG